MKLYDAKCLCGIQFKTYEEFITHQNRIASEEIKKLNEVGRRDEWVNKHTLVGGRYAR